MHLVGTDHPFTDDDIHMLHGQRDLLDLALNNTTSDVNQQLLCSDADGNSRNNVLQPVVLDIQPGLVGESRGFDRVDMLCACPGGKHYAGEWRQLVVLSPERLELTGENPGTTSDIHDELILEHARVREYEPSVRDRSSGIPQHEFVNIVGGVGIKVVRVIVPWLLGFSARGGHLALALEVRGLVVA